MGDDIQRPQRALEEAFGESSDSDDETLSPSVRLCRSPSLLFSVFPFSLFSDRFTPRNLCRSKWTKFSAGNLWRGLMAYGFAMISFPLGIEILFYLPFVEAMRFGDLPDWANDLTRLIRKAVCFGETSYVYSLELECKDQQMEESGPLPFDLLWREPLFDQLIANVYQPGEGICAHVDLMRFDDGIAIVSMESECVMHFSRADQETHALEDGGIQNGSQIKVPVLLKPGSLILMSGEARYSWKHEINRKPGFQIWKGEEICQQRRTSVTLRKLSLI